MHTLNWKLVPKRKGKSSGMSAVAGAGAEAMVVDGRVGGNISVTPKTVGDALGSVYNQVIDPVVDFVAGRDVPGIPEVPEAFDHGITESRNHGITESRQVVTSKADLALQQN